MPGVTSRERLRYLVEALPDEQADELLRLATDRYELPEPRQPLPSFVALGHSGPTDLTEQVDEYLGDDSGHL